MNVLSPATGIRDVVDALRHSGAMKQLTLQPLLATLTAAFVFGAIPMLLTALYAVFRTAFHVAKQLSKGDQS